MGEFSDSRRKFLSSVGIAVGTALFPSQAVSETIEAPREREAKDITNSQNETTSPDYTLRIRTMPIEIAPNRIISLTTYNGQFPWADSPFERRASGHDRHLQRN